MKERYGYKEDKNTHTSSTTLSLLLKKPAIYLLNIGTGFKICFHKVVLMLAIRPMFKILQGFPEGA